MKKIIKMDDCWFFFPGDNGLSYRIEVKNGNAYCNNHWKEVKLYDNGETDLIYVCEMLVKLAQEETNME